MQKHYISLKAQVAQLDHELTQMLGKIAFDRKEREFRKLQRQVKKMDDYVRAFCEHKPMPDENSFLGLMSFPSYFTKPDRPSSFYHTYVSSPPQLPNQKEKHLA